MKKVQDFITTRIGDFITKWSHAVVFGLSIVGITLGIGILFGWFLVEPSTSLTDRASISTGIATVFALFAAFFVLSAGLWVTTTDYRAQQAAKKDTARIRATVWGISDKLGASTQPSADAFKAEREALNEFVLSTTAFGYRQWVLERKEEKRPENRNGLERAKAVDQWDEFFAKVEFLMDACRSSADLERIRLFCNQLQGLLNKLGHEDLRKISLLAGNLTGKVHWPTLDEIAEEVRKRKANEIQQQSLAHFTREQETAGVSGGDTSGR